ncbi:15829_t:CDS:2 [Cetraspora pellucida]|uniref:15829_t:CDS:1 n=1 Tax=Cetraspora pellucida TaxID=1433469 RepID=A0A9N8VGN5_9GLOM|nr:15829_t:CDS:2 [Cetraspora pellucida]
MFESLLNDYFDHNPQKEWALEEHHTDRIAIEDLHNAINTSIIEDLRGEIMEESSKFLEFNQHSIFYKELPSYEEDIEIDPELVLKETNKAMISYFECFFNYDFWNCWTLKSGSVVTELLEKASNVKGHPLKPEVWRIIYCSFKIAKLKWLSNEKYIEILSFAKRSSITSSPKDIIEFLKIKSLKSLGFKVKKFKRDKLNTHLEKITSQNSSEDLNLEAIKITCLILYPEDTFTPDVLEADYEGYLIHLCLKKILVGLEDHLYYHMGEVILSSVKSCRSRRKCISSYEQKSDGVFTIKLRKSLMEIGHLEMSGGYGYKDISQHHKHIFDFIVLLWDLKSLDTQCRLLETSNMIFQLRDEHNDNLFELSKLSKRLPAYPFTPNKDRHKIGIKDANEDSDLDNSSI